MKVALAYVHGDERASSFDDSREALVAHDRAHGRLLDHDHGRMAVRCGTDGLVAARNTVAAQMVSSDVDWLLWVDSDMGFAPDTLYRLLEVAHPQERPVVGALCFASRQYAHDGMNGYRTRPRPTLLTWTTVDGLRRFTTVQPYPVDRLVQVAATGSACILIHRSVLEKVGPDPYTRVPGSDGKLLGEDISFCVRAGAAAVPIHVHTGVRTTHLKPQWVGEPDFWASYPAPPAGERVAVVALDAPEGHAGPFMRSLLASTGLAEAYVTTGEPEPWREAGAAVVAAVEEVPATTPWVFITDAAARFRPGWLDHAQHVAEQFAAPVVAVGDPDLPGTVSGLLVDRRHLEQAGTWSAHDIAQAANAEGALAWALGAVVQRHTELETS